MIKVIVFIKKRADITTEQFRHHYETVHAPLVDVLLPHYSAYRRNYIDGPAMPGAAGDFPCDVVTELEFATPADFEDWQATLADPDVLAQIREDETNFIAAGQTRMCVVSPFASDYSD